MLLVGISFSTALPALAPKDKTEILTIIQNYTHSWNHQGGKGFGDGFTEDADFVNIYGMSFTGKKEIEERHINIIQTIFKDSKFEILDVQLREVYPELVIAKISWRLNGYRHPGSDLTKPGSISEGIFTHVFIHNNNKWEITASQNTLKLQLG
jgi:uncharacterized protein (TIGR02246 family)